MSKLFVCYSRIDKKFALKLFNDLKEKEIEVWIDQLNIPIGKSWDSEIEKALKACDKVIVVLSKDSVNSQNVLDEISFSLNENKTILPLKISDCNIPLRLNRVQFIDFTINYTTGFKELLLSIRKEDVKFIDTTQKVPIEVENNRKNWFESIPRFSIKISIAIFSVIIISTLIFYNTNINNAPIETTSSKPNSESVSTNVKESDSNKSDNGIFTAKLSSGFEIKGASIGIENQLISFIEDTSKPVDKGTWFTFNEVYFDTGLPTLKLESNLQLKNISEIMKAYPKVGLKIGGYTDNLGNPNENLKLSADRAKAVKTALINLGISDFRLESEGYGQEHPVASNETEEGRAQNRRIAARVTAK